MSGVVLLGSLLMTPVTAGNPFRAHYERTVLSKDSGRQKVERGTIVVDREGRARTAIDGGMFEAKVAAIWDPVERAAWMVDDRSNRVLMDIPWPVPAVPEGEKAAVNLVPERPASAIEQSERLGTRTIEGLDCEGSRLRIEGTHGTMTVERWFSRDLGHVLLETTDRTTERVTFRMSDVRRVDPDPEAFRPRR